MNRLYLAYGSNLSKEQMKRRCPASQEVAGVSVSDWRLAFVGFSRVWGGGVATLAQAPEAVTPAALYSLNAEDEAKLDEFERVSTGYYIKVERFFEFNGQAAYTYLCTNSDPYPPSAAYLNTILTGYRNWDLPAGTLNALIQAFG